MPLVQVQQGEPFKHCDRSAFLFARSVECQALKSVAKLEKRRRSTESCTDFLCGIYEFAQLSVSVLAGVGGFLDRVGEVLCYISGFVKAFVCLFKGGVVGIKVTLLAVENCLRIVQLYLPALGSSVILAE